MFCFVVLFRVLLCRFVLSYCVVLMVELCRVKHEKYGKKRTFHPEPWEALHVTSDNSYVNQVDFGETRQGQSQNSNLDRSTPAQIIHRNFHRRNQT